MLVINTDKNSYLLCVLLEFDFYLVSRLCRLNSVFESTEETVSIFRGLICRQLISITMQFLASKNVKIKTAKLIS